MVKPVKSKPVKASSKASSSTLKASSAQETTTKSKSKSSVKLYSSFNPIPISIPSPIPIPSSSKRPLTSTTHYIYVRPHKSSSATSEEDRTVFATNLPVDITERDLRLIFGKWGVVESVTLGREQAGDVLEKAVKGSLEEEDSDLSDDEEEEEEEVEQGEEGEKKEPQFIHNGQTGLTKSQKRRAKRNKGLPPSIPTVTPLPSLTPRTYGPSGSHIAYITFLDSQSLSSVMSYSGPAISLPKFGNDLPTGIEYYKSLQSTSRPSHTAIKVFADTSMERYDRLHSLLLSSRARQKGAGALVDEDGFTVVVRGGRYGRTGGRGDEGKKSLGVGVAKRGLGPKEAKGGAAALTDFYKFQKVDRKRKGTFSASRLNCADRKELADLRLKFDHDKAKVEELKRSKRFKPY
jgi:ribosomal RNA-processing protein 7